ncbi:14915_t:CDS:2, partial [Acaulospora morrowiae]
FSRSKIVDLKDDLRIMWTNDYLRSLIDERKTRNVEYYDIVSISREDFWNSIANKINGQFNTTYSRYQCKGKFQSLVKDYNISILSGEHLLQLQLSLTMRLLLVDVPVYVGDRSASPTQRTPSRRDETTNRDNASNLGRDLGNNINNVGGNLSDNTNNASENSGHNANSANGNSNNNTTHNDIHGSSSNIPASQNGSNVNMAKAGSSQPINEES